MNRFKRPSGGSAIYQEDATVAAESVHKDFSELVSLLDQQLANLSEGEGRARSHILEARAAAERGLKLSKQLIELLRTSD